MKAIVIYKKHLTLVSHTNGVVIVEEKCICYGYLLYS